WMYKDSFIAIFYKDLYRTQSIFIKTKSNQDTILNENNYTLYPISSDGCTGAAWRIPGFAGPNGSTGIRRGKQDARQLQHHLRANRFLQYLSTRSFQIDKRKQSSYF